MGYKEMNSCGRRLGPSCEHRFATGVPRARSPAISSESRSEPATIRLAARRGAAAAAGKTACMLSSGHGFPFGEPKLPASYLQDL